LEGVPDPWEKVLMSNTAASSALVEAHRVTSAAAEVGFDWPELAPVRAKLDEEIAELDQAVACGSPERVADELGDVLFTVVNLARHLGVSAESALSGTTAKFLSRFAAVEKDLAARGVDLSEASLDAMQAAWERAKVGEAPCSSG
jgi:uncharacterized protein YabN with tetrapyrrole methylase and pyrophosphatase domain